MAVLFCGFAAAASGAAVLLYSNSPHVAVAAPLPWPLIAVAMVLAGQLDIQLRSGNHSVNVSLTPIPVGIACVFVRPTWLLVSTLIAGAAWVVKTRRSRPDRAVVSAMNDVLGVCLAYVAFRAILDHHSPVYLRGMVAVGTSVIVYEAVTMLGVLAMITVTSGFPGKGHLGSMGFQLGLVVPYNAVLAMIAVSIGYQDRWALLLLAAPAVALGLWYRTSNTIKKRYSSLQLLYQFTVKLADSGESEKIIGTALEESRSLLTAQHAQLAIPHGAGAYRWELLPNGSSAKGSGPLEKVEHDVIATGEAVIRPKSRHHGAGGTTFDDLLAAPVPLGEIGSGVLLVANHRGTETFDLEQLRLFEAIAAHLSTALTSSRRLEQLKEQMAAREYEALHDSLTGLANRTLFAQWVSGALQDRKPNRSVAVMVMDLDGFKDINDSLGHHSGDLFLQELARRINSRAGPGQMAARLGGDEFAFVLSDVEDEISAAEVARTILAAASRPAAIEGMVLELRASIGIALSPQHGEDAATLLQNADMAMYAAKASKRGVIVYDSEMERSTKRRLMLASNLRHALESGDIEVWYQPVARSDTGWTSGCEALLRWRTEDEFVSPLEFIPVAEQTGIIEPLTWWTLEAALRELNQWRLEDICPSVAVNLSARLLQLPDFLPRVEELLDRLAVPPPALTLEITESMIMADADAAERMLAKLQAMGVQVAIDDFGTGYSSLSRLKRLPVDTIKIDREFVMNMHTDESDEAIVRAALDLARTLGRVVVAEGVEKFETWHRLQAFGCQQIQGYLLAKPMPATEIRQWLRSRKQLMAAEPLLRRVASDL